MSKIINGKEYVTSKAYWMFGYTAGIFGMLFGGLLMWFIMKFP